MINHQQNYLLLLDEADFFVAHDAFVVEDFLHALLEHLQEESCSTAIDQNFSSCPIGHPAFCHK